ncbi:iron-sulfur cluster assembly scaffold protein [uncultured Erythrobacter sp.]|uniref:iron-sulfur cluster assembly scaffold protein n=1 Tax=uncultured Erythrobacter sp. TaxID=263913 RepID=UPI002638D3F1|nr:iron-sulfur cluster assembly scaffold protein [uncultured Erythrobacter sp.]
MADQLVAKLYTPNLLALSTQLADFPLDKDFAHRAEVRSRTCGSTIEIGVDLAPDGKVSRLGMQISACAVGQSSAAIMALGVRGILPEQIESTKKAIEAWLSSEDADAGLFPDWPRLESLRPAWQHKGRHDALLLAWTAVTQALSSGTLSR